MKDGDTRPISWVKAARKNFDALPVAVQVEAADALTIAAEGGRADTAKPLHGMRGGVFEIALRWRGDAYRIVYALQIGPAVWVIHVFQKKSKTGIKTPQFEVDLIHERLRRLKEALK